MTAQIPDTLLVGDQELFIVAINGDELFNPAFYGLKPYPTFTACWRGYLCQYAVCDGRLVLDHLKMSLMQLNGLYEDEGLIGHAGPAINGVRPYFPNDEYPPLNNRYEWLNLEVPFTGRLLAATGFIQELYITLGFHAAWQYKTVFELIAVNGKVLDICDVSPSVAAIREALARRPLLPNARAGEHNLQAWIASTFKLNYNQ